MLSGVDIETGGYYKGGCLRRPRAARRMLPAASTVRSASPASRARRGFTFQGNCEDFIRRGDRTSTISTAARRPVQLTKWASWRPSLKFVEHHPHTRNDKDQDIAQIQESCMTSM